MEQKSIQKIKKRKQLAKRKTRKAACRHRGFPTEEEF